MTYLRKNTEKAQTFHRSLLEAIPSAKLQWKSKILHRKLRKTYDSDNYYLNTSLHYPIIDYINVEKKQPTSKDSIPLA